MALNVLGGIASAGLSFLGGRAQRRDLRRAEQNRINFLREGISRFEGTPVVQTYMPGGARAFSTRQALLGLGGTEGGGPDYAAYGEANPDVSAAYGNLSDADRNYLIEQGFDVNDDGTISGDEYSGYHFGTYGEGEGRDMPMREGQSSTDAANEAFNNYLQSSDYQFRMGSGTNAITGSRAASGILNSGRTGTELVDFGQQLGSRYMDRYLDNLNQDAQTGLQASMAYGNVLTGSASQLASGAAQYGNNQAGVTGNMYEGIAGGIGQVLGSDTASRLSNRYFGGGR
jgi:hypothetical protein